MLFRITKKTTKKQVDEWFASLPPSKVEHLQTKVFDITKIKEKPSGKLDAKKIQKELRREWM